MDSRTKEILSKISIKQWNNYYHELVLYAEAKCDRWTWKTGNKENLPNGYSPESIATEAVQRFFRGTRIWNHETYPDENPIPFLKSVVRSIVSEIGRGKAHKTTASLETETLQPADSDKREYETELPPKIISGFNPQREPTAYEKIFYEQTHRRIMSVIEDDEDLLEFHRLKCGGLKLPAIAREMNKTKEVVEALRVKFARRTKKIKEELFQELEQINRIPEGGARISALKRR